MLRSTLLVLIFIASMPIAAWESKVVPAIQSVPGSQPVPADVRPRMLPDGEVVYGRQGLSAWLAMPTRRYTHGVLGDDLEAGALVVETAEGKQLTLQLPENFVFEDRYPRFADLDGDGDDEIYLVLTNLYRGAALVVIDIREEKLRIVARSEAIGQRFRWLNPVGAGDFDGDGRMEIAVVITPHIGGILTIYEFKENQLTPEYEAQGFSNHFIGSRALAMSAVVDLDGDGIDDLAVPDARRQSLRMMSIKNNRLSELGTVEQGSRINTAIVQQPDPQGNSRLTYGLEDGRRIEVHIN